MTNRKKINWQEVKEFFILILLVSLFYRTFIRVFIFNSSAIPYFDGVQHYSYLDFIKHNFFSLWNPYIFSGTSAISDLQLVRFYPLSLLLFFFSTIKVLQLYYIIHLFIGAITIYFLAKFYKFSFLGCLTTAIIFIHTGFFVWRVNAGHTFLISGASLIPLIFLLIEKFFYHKKLIYSILASIVIVFQIILYPQITSYTLFCLFLYFIFNLCFKYEKGFFKKVIICFFFIFISCLLSAIQLLPSFEIASYLARCNATDNFKWASSFSLDPKNLIYFIYPEKFHYEEFLRDNRIFLWVNGSYLGLIPTILVIIGFILAIIKRNKQKIFMGIIMLFSLLFAFGNYTPFFKIFYILIPVFRMFRDPERFLSLFIFASAILAGYSIDMLFAKKEKKIEITKNVIFLILILELFMLGRRCAGSLKNIYKSFPVKNKIIEFLKKDPDVFRIAGNLPFYPNSSMVNNIRSIEGSSYVLNKRYAEFICAVNNKSIDSIDISGAAESIKIENFNSKLLSLLNIKYILTKYPINYKNWSLVLEDEGTKIYKNNLFVPRIFLVPQVKIVENEKKILEEMKKDSFDYKKTVILEEKINTLLNKEKILGETKEIKSKNDEIIIKVKTDNPCFLVLSENYFPGWKVFVDGKQKKLFRANYFMQAVFLSSGFHKVKFMYSPFSFKIGAFISCITLLIIILICFLIYTKGDK